MKHEPFGKIKVLIPNGLVFHVSAKLPPPALVDAARELLVTGGYEAVSFSALAERTGLARPSVYSYFESKDDIVLAVCEASLPGFLPALKPSIIKSWMSVLHTSRTLVVYSAARSAACILLS